MAGGRTTLEESISRRQEVERLDLQGLSHRAIARRLKCDPRTVRTDLEAIAKDRQEEQGPLDDVRRRLMAKAERVEHTAWERLNALQQGDEASAVGYLRTILSAQERQAKLADAMAGSDLERQLAELREQLGSLMAAATSAAPSAPTATPLRRVK